MEIYNNVENLGALLGLGRAGSADGAVRQGGRSPGAPSAGADRATLSGAGSEAAQTAGVEAVRTDKVAAVQAALASGTYRVPAEAVASKLVDSMLGDDR